MTANPSRDLMRSPSRVRPTLRALAAAALPLAFGACDWFTDFKSQPRVEPWEPLSQADGDTIHPPRGNPQFSVPISGTFAAGYQVSYRPMPNVVDSMSPIPNPTPVSPASLENGRKHYAINCAVCHGDTGAGNGPATQNQYGMPPISIITAATQARTDGYIYGMIRNGRGLMPTYNRIEEMDRWDVVNYVRALQGRVQNTAGVGAVGYPGQTGSTLPGYSATAPTRPAPHFRDTRGPGTPPGAPQVRTPAEAQGVAPAAVPPVTDSGPRGRGIGGQQPGAAGAPAARPDTQALNQTKRPTP